MKTWFIMASLMAALSLTTLKEVEAQSRTPSHSFGDYSVAVYHGSAAKPNFRSKAGSERFKTRIREGIDAGVNFAGHYAIVVFGCGAGCSLGFLVDVKSGRIFDFPLGGEKNYSLSLDYRKNSRLLNARWIDGMGDDKPTCVRQAFVLNGNVFKLIHQTRTKGEECYR